MVINGYGGTVVKVVPANRTRAHGHKTHAKHPKLDITLCLHFPGIRTEVVQTDKVTCRWCVDRISNP